MFALKWDDEIKLKPDVTSYLADMAFVIHYTVPLYLSDCLLTSLLSNIWPVIDVTSRADTVIDTLLLAYIYFASYQLSLNPYHSMRKSTNVML